MLWLMLWFGLGGSKNDAPMSKVDIWLVRYFTWASVVFSGIYISIYISHSENVARGSVCLLAAIAILKCLTVTPSANAFRGRSTVVLTLLLIVALFNILVSWSMLETALRWVLWFAIIISFTRIAGASNGTWTEVLIRRLPLLFLIIYFTVLVMAHFTSGAYVGFAYHLSGLYGNLIMATGLFAIKTWQRVFWLLVGLVAIFFSGAGGALFTIPIMFVPYILYNTSSMPVKGVAVTGMLILGALFFLESQLFTRFLDIKLATGYDAGNAYNGLDRLDRSKEMRFTLIQFGLDLARQNPLGTGLGHTYADQISGVMGVSHVHNGTISMLIELGLPGFAVVASLLLWIFWSILNNPTIPQQAKAFYFTYFFTVFGRSLSENYTPFDLGNFFNFIFLAFTIYFFLYQRMPQRGPAPNGPMGYRPGYGRPAPGFRAPMPRPVGVR